MLSNSYHKQHHAGKAVWYGWSYIPGSSLEQGPSRTASVKSAYRCSAGLLSPLPLLSPTAKHGAFSQLTSPSGSGHLKPYYRHGYRANRAADSSEKFQKKFTINVTLNTASRKGTEIRMKDILHKGANSIPNATLLVGNL